MASSSGREPRPAVQSTARPALARDPEPLSSSFERPAPYREPAPSGIAQHRGVAEAGARISRPRARRHKLLYEKRIALFAILAAVPGVGFGTVLIWTHNWTPDVKISLTALELFLWLVLTLALLDQIVRPLQTLANVVGALREEDYSFRARGAAPNDAMGELALEINALADILTEQRLQSIEATALLRRVVQEIDAPLFTFDPDHILRLVNAAGERLLQQPSARLLGKTAAELELNACFEAANETLVALPYSAPNARWMVRKSSFRQSGVPHTLIVLSDVSRALREEERSAWQKLIRVLGHELNNSLAPIISIAGSLSSRLPLPELPEAQNADFQRGLGIIESRTASLHRFLQSYRRLAQMPSPTLQPTELRPLLERVANLETRLKVDISPGPDLILMIDPDLIEQMLINLVRNAVDAALEQAQAPQSGEPVPPSVTLRWEQFDRRVALIVEDNGIGLLNPGNAFVPFYTTKPGGSGIGLVLSQQIAEAHGGSIELANRTDERGCRVKVMLPYRHS
ncbi:MAG TPA: ATP-binding protein [Candidatus Binatia bacterium]|nr:ATP-binding protein [Candidatus Binatia bacterium]